MRQLCPALLLFLLVGCTETVEVAVEAPTAGWEAYGVETVAVTCHPTRFVDYVELLVDSAVVGTDSSTTYQFPWDVTGLAEGSVHTVQARATVGSREYLSAELLATVGFRSRLLADGDDDSLLVYLPNGSRDTGFVPSLDGPPLCPRFRPGCTKAVYIGDRRLIECALPAGTGQVLDSVLNGIYSCDASPMSELVAFEGFPAATAHLFTKDGTGPKTQLTHDSDFVLIDSSRFTCTANSGPAFSPDGLRIAYFRQSKCLVPGDPHEGETRQDVFVMNRDGSNLVNLTPAADNGYFSGLAWTFDGKWVLFREGEGTTPDRVLASNLTGRTLVLAGINPTAMACSPSDSTLIYIGAGTVRNLFGVRLVWTGDTIYVRGPAQGLNADVFRRYLDWVAYPGE